MKSIYQRSTRAQRAGEPDSGAQTVPSRGRLEAQLEEYKERLLMPVLATVTNTALARELKWAATEAAALAWYTACPLLVLPLLLEEKVRAAYSQWEKQQRIRGSLTA